MESWLGPVAMHQYLQHRERLQLENVTSDEVAAVTAQFNRLCERFGKDYSTEYGWAIHVLGKSRATFADLEANVELAHWRPYYKLASSATHAGAKGVLFNIGIPSAAMPLLPTGSSNTELADPAQGCAISLMQVTSALLVYRPMSQDILLLRALTMLVDRIEEDLIRAHRTVEERTAKNVAAMQAKTAKHG